MPVDDSESTRAERVDPYCLKEGEADRLLAGHPWKRFVVLGDSVAEGLGDPVPGYLDQPWADRLATALKRHSPDMAHLNTGRRNTRAALVRSTQLTEVLDFRPDLALVACGGYDTLVTGFDAERVGAELRAIVTALRETGCTVITVSMIDGSRGPRVPAAVRDRLGERLRDLSEVTGRLARDLDTVHIDLFDHPVGGEDGLLSADGRHANRRGHAIAATEAIRTIGAYLDRTGVRNGVA
ncbi:SGNH/GDSL hydrolase family protein [Streptomyces sp. NPDC015220]|uniref:SGNH/GDSL hydrolase family protein n=1 Tax=Streptomyces sp. NPDC015220 TaxID=3364947 RepID=UPI003702724C